MSHQTLDHVDEQVDGASGATPDAVLGTATISGSANPVNDAAVPILGESILSRPATIPETTKTTTSAHMTDLDILNHVASSLQNEGQVTVKQEPSDETFTTTTGTTIIDLTGPDPVMDIDDEDEDGLPQTSADRLPQVGKRSREHASSEDGPSQKKTKRGGQGKGRSKTQAKKPASKKRPSIIPTESTTVRSIAGANLFRDIATMDATEDLPDWYDKTKNRVSSLATLASKVSQGTSRDEKCTINDDKRKLNWACTQFGSGNLRPNEDSTWWMKGMKSTLRSHQVIGTAWMMRREKSDEAPFGGILADQMGLGKTVMSLALIVHTRNDGRGDSNRAKTTLVIGNAALKYQWYNEIGIHCHSGRTGIQTFKKYSSKEGPENKKAAINELTGTDIVLTTFEEVMKSYPLKDPPPELVDADERQVWWEKHFEEHKGVLHSITFKRIIVDEAHLIRNPVTHRSRACRALTGKHRWALTGTPYVNGPFDLFTLFDFVKLPLPFGVETMRHQFKVNIDPEMEHELNGYIAKCVLRRDRTDKLFCRKMVSLPSSNFKCVVVEFNIVEREIYNTVIKRLRERVARTTVSGSQVIRNNSILALITRCRQMTSHPLVLQGSLCDLLERSDLIRLENKLKTYNNINNSGRSQGLEIIKLLRSALQNHKERSDKLSKAGVVSTLQSTPGGSSHLGTGSRHGQDYNIGKCFEEWRKFQDLLDNGGFSECNYCYKTATQPSITSCWHIYCGECLQMIQEEAAQKGEPRATCANHECGVVFHSAESLDEATARCLASSKATTTKTKKGTTKKVDLPASVLDVLDRGGGPIAPSAKTLAVKAQILEWKKDCPREKIIIYTQWIPMVRILHLMCKIEGWKCCKYTGDMSHFARQKVLEEFATDDSLTIMLIGLKCGSLGLNLTMANHVICIDPWWNNAVEEQAFSRVHRIGQERETEFLQVVVKDSIDEKMQEIKAKKQGKIETFDNVGDLKKLTDKELLSLFGEVVEDEHGGLHFLDEDEDEDEDDENDGGDNESAQAEAGNDEDAV